MSQEGFAVVGDVVLDHGVEGGVEKLSQLRPRLDAGADQVATIDGKHLACIGLPRLQQIVGGVRISSIVST